MVELHSDEVVGQGNCVDGEDGHDVAGWEDHNCRDNEVSPPRLVRAGVSGTVLLPVQGNHLVHPVHCKGHQHSQYDEQRTGEKHCAGDDPGQVGGLGGYELGSVWDGVVEGDCEEEDWEHHSCQRSFPKCGRLEVVMRPAFVVLLRPDVSEYCPDDQAYHDKAQHGHHYLGLLLADKNPYRRNET